MAEVDSAVICRVGSKKNKVRCSGLGKGHGAGLSLSLGAPAIHLSGMWLLKNSRPAVQPQRPGGLWNAGGKKGLHLFGGGGGLSKSKSGCPRASGPEGPEGPEDTAGMLLLEVLRCVAVTRRDRCWRGIDPADNGLNKRPFTSRCRF